MACAAAAFLGLADADRNPFLDGGGVWSAESSESSELAGGIVGNSRFRLRDCLRPEVVLVCGNDFLSVTLLVGVVRYDLLLALVLGGGGGGGLSSSSEHDRGAIVSGMFITSSICLLISCLVGRPLSGECCDILCRAGDNIGDWRSIAAADRPGIKVLRGLAPCNKGLVRCPTPDKVRGLADTWPPLWLVRGLGLAMD